MQKITARKLCNSSWVSHSTHYRSFRIRSSQRVIWLVQKPSRANQSFGRYQ